MFPRPTSSHPEAVDYDQPSAVNSASAVNPSGSSSPRGLAQEVVVGCCWGPQFLSFYFDFTTRAAFSVPLWASGDTAPMAASQFDARQNLPLSCPQRRWRPSPQPSSPATPPRYGGGSFSDEHLGELDARLGREEAASVLLRSWIQGSQESHSKHIVVFL